MYELFTGISLEDYRMILLPGGFLFGDELGAAKAFANRISFALQQAEDNLKQRLQDYVAKGNCILGICNGFQLLVKLGLLPNFFGSEGHQMVTLTNNDSCQFEARWVLHDVCPSPCVFTQGIEELYLPVRHAEGKFVTASDAVRKKLFHNHQVVLRYAVAMNPNGSVDDIAGICDQTGRVFGMMAHPEAALFATNHPQWTRQKEEAKREGKKLPEHGPGFELFRNAIRYLEAK